MACSRWLRCFLLQNALSLLFICYMPYLPHTVRAQIDTIFFLDSAVSSVAWSTVANSAGSVLQLTVSPASFNVSGNTTMTVLGCSVVKGSNNVAKAELQSLELGPTGSAPSLHVSSVPVLAGQPLNLGSLAANLSSVALPGQASSPGEGKSATSDVGPSAGNISGVVWYPTVTWSSVNGYIQFGYGGDTPKKRNVNATDVITPLTSFASFNGIVHSRSTNESQLTLQVTTTFRMYVRDFLFATTSTGSRLERIVGQSHIQMTLALNGTAPNPCYLPLAS